MFLSLMEVKLKKFQFQLCLCQLFSPLLGASHLCDLSVFLFMNAFTFGSFLEFFYPMASLLSWVLDVPCKLLVFSLLLRFLEWGDYPPSLRFNFCKRNYPNLEKLRWFETSKNEKNKVNFLTSYSLPSIFPSLHLNIPWRA